MASTAMVASEATVVATAMPGIVADVGGLELYSWVFSSYLLAQTATTVVAGKLADLFGRRPVMFGGIFVFVVSSVLAGFAPSMTWLIIFRLVQGIGAGAIVPASLTIVADMYRPVERGKVQGFLASVWATCAVIGPLAGSVIVQQASWPWIFWINVPIGIAAACGFALYLHEPAREKLQVSVDYLGAALFAGAVGALMLALSDAADAHSGRIALESGVFAVCSVAFIAQERRARDPMVSLRLWGLRPIAVCNLATVFCGMAFMGLTTFLPMFLQAVGQHTPVAAGLALTMLLVGWPVGATLAARTFSSFGLRKYLMLGSAAMPLGASLFLLLSPNSSILIAAFGSFVMGFGMGVISTCSIILIQESVSVSERGSATASNIFSRNLGNTLGAALFGAVQAYVFKHSPGTVEGGLDQVRHLLTAKSSDFAALAPIRAALDHSLQATFVSVFIVAMMTVAVMFYLPKIRLASLTTPAGK
jgi:EmrB/QacA subfamily drug resistance transporter